MHTRRSARTAPALSREELREVFAVSSEDYRPLVGFEYEVMCFQADTLRPLRLAGPSGLEAVLGAITQSEKGAVHERSAHASPKVILPEGSFFTLEPGGQLEFSSVPKGTFGSIDEQISQHTRVLRHLEEEFDLHYFFGGVNPVHSIDEVGLVVAKPRYLIMNDHFSRSGSMGQSMMRLTASVQVTFDYKNEADGIELLRTALLIAPLASALFAHSPFMNGKATGFRSNRVPIWANTDPMRSGLPFGFTSKDFSFDTYIDRVLETPLLFVNTPEGLVPGKNMTFDELNRCGFDGHWPNINDFVLHNSTMFTDVRLKRGLVEVRSVDAQDPHLLPSAIAFMSGILFCGRARRRVQELLGDISEHEYHQLPERLSREGLSGKIDKTSAQHVLLELIDLAHQGLPTCFVDGEQAARHLDPIRVLAEHGKTPADIVLERFDNDPQAWLKAGHSFPWPPR